MGTRGVVHIKDSWQDRTLVTVYTQYDGYPSGFGMKIKSILNNGDVEIINGISGNQQIPSHFNGMGCLAAYLIGKLKGSSLGGIYIHPIDDQQEYEYTLRDKEGKLHVTVESSYAAGDGLMYEGLLSDFDPKNLGE